MGNVSLMCLDEVETKMSGISRRSFLRRSVGLAAVPYVVPGAVLGKDGAVAPSEKITVVCIGMGRHGIGCNLKMYLGQVDAKENLKQSI